VKSPIAKIFSSPPAGDTNSCNESSVAGPWEYHPFISCGPRLSVIVASTLSDP
jgi:hypothetical protein